MRKHFHTKGIFFLENDAGIVVFKYFKMEKEFQSDDEARHRIRNAESGRARERDVVYGIWLVVIHTIMLMNIRQRRYFLGHATKRCALIRVASGNVGM